MLLFKEMSFYRYILFTLLLSVSDVPAWSDVEALEALVGKDIPWFQCRTYGSWGTLSDKGLEKLEEVRPLANKHCLVCRGAQCALKRWPEDQDAGRSLCQSLYCIPKSYPRAVTSEQSGWAAHLAEVRFKISKDGRGALTEYVARTNEDRIRPYNREINRTIKSFLHSTRFVPLIVDGEKKEIVNLSYVVQINND